MKLLMVNNPMKILTGYFGPIPKNTVGLLLRQNNNTMRELIVYTEIIDKNYTDKITIITFNGKVDKIYDTKLGNNTKEVIIKTTIETIKIDKIMKINRLSNIL